MPIVEDYIEALTATEYTTDPDTYRTLASDVRQMWDIWNTTEFDGELRPLAVWPTDDTGSLGVDAERDTKTSGAFFCNSRVIIIDTAANILGTKDGTTLYHHIAETLLHEMCHQFCKQNGIEDTGEDGTHNEKFRDAARAHGLITHRSTMGWNRTRVRKGHWKPFYEHATRDLARRMRNTHIPYEDEEA